MKVAVLGGEGFIGKTLCEYLRNEGHGAISIDVRGTPTETLDLSEIESGMLLDYGVDHVIDCAGKLGTLETFEEVEETIEANIINTNRAIQASIRAGVPFTFVTLSHTWLNPYMITKNCANELCKMYAALGHKIRSVATYNLFGPHQKLRPVRKLVPTVMAHILRDEPVEVFDDGEQIVDMIFAPDFAKELMALIVNEPPGYYHIGSGIGMTVNEVVSACEEALDKTAKIVYLPKRESEPHHFDGRSPTSWRYITPTPMDVAFDVTAAWYREHLEEL